MQVILGRLYGMNRIDGMYGIEKSERVFGGDLFAQEFIDGKARMGVLMEEMAMRDHDIIVWLENGFWAKIKTKIAVVLWIESPMKFAFFEDKIVIARHNGDGFSTLPTEEPERSTHDFALVCIDCTRNGIRRFEKQHLLEHIAVRNEQIDAFLDRLLHNRVQRPHVHSLIQAEPPRVMIRCGKGSHSGVKSASV